ncbi:4-hydroxyphenylacetate 3-hydroxylase N-terminal domain-containing protein [Prauserella flavalba]|uniref:4-hydroxyphenylacetate 3-hydroxylase N-terminal domain-containing protein n=1 Tax=Prauserella flavalba TaxID=1477506 RepID=UPI0036E6E2FA
MHVVKECEDGIVVRSARMISTGAAFRHVTYVSQYLRPPVPADDKDFALGFFVPFHEPEREGDRHWLRRSRPRILGPDAPHPPHIRTSPTCASPVPRGPARHRAIDADDGCHLPSRAPRDLPQSSPDSRLGRWSRRCRETASITRASVRAPPGDPRMSARQSGSPVRTELGRSTAL